MSGFMLAVKPFNETGTRANAPDVTASTEMATPKVHIRWGTSARLWCAVICTAAVGLLGCITAITFAAAAPMLVPGLVALVYAFYRVAIGCLLTALLAAFFFIFAIEWVPA
jgi:hypothetical protein